jgi:hypothetical protein
MFVCVAQGGSTEQQVSSPVNQSSAHINIKAIVNVGKVELEMMRHLPEIRSVEPLAVFKVFFIQGLQGMTKV